MNNNENRDFFIPLALDAPVRDIPWEYCHPVLYGKTRMLELPDGEKNFEDMYNRLDRIPACDRQTDKQTDSQTDRRIRQTDILPRHSPRYANASRAKNGQSYPDVPTDLTRYILYVSLID